MAAPSVTVLIRVGGEVKHFAEMPEDQAVDYIERVFTLYDEDDDVRATVTGWWGL